MYAKRRDANEQEIVKALEKIGCKVVRLHTPADLLVGYRAKNFLIECKGKAGRKTEDQAEFFATWPGQIRLVKTVDEALDLVTKAYQRNL